MVEVLEITLSMLSCLQRNDCGTGDNSFRSYHVYKGMIVVLEISLSEVIMFIEE